MSEKLIMPKNVQLFVDKYGGIGSKEQDLAFWKEFRKAANAYANVQAKRICDLEHALAEGKKYSNKIEDKLRVDLRGHPNSELWGDAGLIAATMRCVDAVDTLTEQRDRLVQVIEAATILIAAKGRHNTMLAYNGLRDALQSLNQDHFPDVGNMIGTTTTKP